MAEARFFSYSELEASAQKNPALKSKLANFDSDELKEEMDKGSYVKMSEKGDVQLFFPDGFENKYVSSANGRATGAELAKDPEQIAKLKDAYIIANPGGHPADKLTDFAEKLIEFKRSLSMPATAEIKAPVMDALKAQMATGHNPFKAPIEVKNSPPMQVSEAGVPVPGMSFAPIEKSGQNYPGSSVSQPAPPALQGANPFAKYADTSKGDVLLDSKDGGVQSALRQLKQIPAAMGGVMSGAKRFSDPMQQSLAFFQNAVGLYKNDASKRGEPTALTMAALDAYSKTAGTAEAKLEAAQKAVKMAASPPAAIPASIKLNDLLRRAEAKLSIKKEDIQSVIKSMVAENDALKGFDKTEAVKTIESAVEKALIIAAGKGDIPKDDPKLVLLTLQAISNTKDGLLNILKSNGLPDDVAKAATKAIQLELDSRKANGPQKAAQISPGLPDKEPGKEREKSTAKLGILEAVEKTIKVTVGSMKDRFDALLWGKESREVTVKVGEGESPSAAIAEASKKPDFGEMLKGAQLAIGNLAYSQHEAHMDPHHGVTQQGKGQAQAAAPSAAGGPGMPA